MLAEREPERFLVVSLWARWAAVVPAVALAAALFYVARYRGLWRAAVARLPVEQDALTQLLRSLERKDSRDASWSNELVSAFQGLAFPFDKALPSTLLRLFEHYDPTAFKHFMVRLLGSLLYGNVGGSHEGKECFVVVRDSSQGRLVAGFGTHVDDAYLAELFAHVLETPVCRTALASGSVVVMQRAMKSDLLTPDGWSILGCRSVLVAPIQTGPLEGVLAVQASVEKAFDRDSDVTYIAYLADAVGLALRARLVTEQSSQSEGAK